MEVETPGVLFPWARIIGLLEPILNLVLLPPLEQVCRLVRKPFSYLYSKALGKSMTC